MNSLLLDLIVPGGRRPPRVIHDVVVGRLLDTGVGGSSSSMWTVLIAVVALIACVSLAIAYRRRTVANA